MYSGVFTGSRKVSSTLGWRMRSRKLQVDPLTQELLKDFGCTTILRAARERLLQKRSCAGKKCPEVMIHKVQKGKKNFMTDSEKLFWDQIWRRCQKYRLPQHWASKNRCTTKYTKHSKEENAHATAIPAEPLRQSPFSEKVCAANMRLEVGVLALDVRNLISCNAAVNTFAELQDHIALAHRSNCRV